MSIPPSSSSTSASLGTVHPRAIDHLPPKDPDSTRFVLLSDTHTHTFPVPDGDVLLHAGDLTERGSPKELKVTVDWLCSLPHKHKVIIAGNHDYCLDAETLKESMIQEYAGNYEKAMQIINSPKAKSAGLIYLEDSSVEIPIAGPSSSSNGSSSGERQSWKIYGSPWSAAFCSMAFNVPRGDASAELYAQVPESTEILLTHGPPLGMLDKTRHGNRHVGCDKLLARVQDGLPQLRMHIWGHIHEDRGVIIDEEGFYGRNAGGKNVDGLNGGSEGISTGDEETPTNAQRRRGTIFVNAANAGTFERPRRLWGEGKYQPMVVDLKNE